jgi:4-hydroxybenzoyl-CoA reductase subunit beta
MMRLDTFRYLAPRTLAEAARMLAEEGPGAMPMAGGTDLIPNMKRRQQTPRVIVGLRRIDELRRIDGRTGMRLGAGLTLSALVDRPEVARHYPGLWQAVSQIATPHLRNMGTLGGNLCLDTRCNYYDQNHEWRQAIGFCMKKDGETCWVAPGSDTCLAVSSTDAAPALISLGARVRLVSSEGEREADLSVLYRPDGIAYMDRRPGEILAEVILPEATGWRSSYWKLRRRGSFDFPVLSVAVAARLSSDRTVEAARIVLGSVSMRPIEARPAADLIAGRRLDDAAIEEAAEVAAREAKPMDNTDYALHWRKRMARALVTYALREVRGDDVTDLKRRLAHRTVLPACA